MTPISRRADRTPPSRTSATRSERATGDAADASERTTSDATAMEADAVPADLGALEAGEVLCDRHRRECFQVLGIDDSGVSLRQEETRFYVPHSLFAPWYGSRLFPIAETTSTECPAWCVDGGSR